MAKLKKKDESRIQASLCDFVRGAAAWLGERVAKMTTSYFERQILSQRGTGPLGRDRDVNVERKAVVRGYGCPGAQRAAL